MPIEISRHKLSIEINAFLTEFNSISDLGNRSLCSSSERILARRCDICRDFCSPSNPDIENFRFLSEFPSVARENLRVFSLTDEHTESASWPLKPEK